MTPIQWIREIDLDTLPNLDDYGAMWANGQSRRPKIAKPKKKGDFVHVVDLSKKFPYVIHELFTTFGYSVYVEIGVAYGGGLRLVNKCNPNATIIGVDPMYDKDVKDNFNSSVSRSGFSNDIFGHRNVHMLLRSSDDKEVLDYLNNNFAQKIDFINIDGDHSYEGCLKDLKNYCHLIRNEGIIWLDDVGSIPEVKRALDDFVIDAPFDVWDWYGKGTKLNKRGIDGVFLLKC